MSTTSSFSRASQITTNIRYEPGLLASQTLHDAIADRFKTMSDFYLLAFHQDKLMNAAKRCNWPTQVVERYSGARGLQVLYAKILLHIHEDRRVDGPLQVSLALTEDGVINFSSSPAFEPGLLFPVDLSDQHTEPSLRAFGILYQRSSIRVVIDDRILPLPGTLQSSTLQTLNFEDASTTQQKLTVSQYGEVLHGGFTTPYFLRDGIWITPAFSGIAAESVTRRYALEHGLCKEGIILRSSLKHGDRCWLSDGIRGFFRGTIFLPHLTPKQDWLDRLFEEDGATTQRDVKKLSRGERKNSMFNEGEDGVGDDDDVPQTIPGSSISDTKFQSPKRPNPFAASAPSPRRSKRGRLDFIPTCLADEDEVSRPRDYKAIPTPEHRGVIHRRYLPDP